MIEFTHETTRYKVKPENAQTIRALAAKPPKIKIKVDRRFDSMRRHYPKFYAGLTTTADYVLEYASINDHQKLIGLEYTHANRLAPMLDATQPEVWEEVDADYVEPVKAKKLTAKQAITQALKALEKGEIDIAQCILAEGLK
jgi:membrane-bound lytic murein transglycosylase MltF